jgi:MraZ protein
MLRGNALAKLDDKGRLKLPAQFRAILEPTYGNEFFVTSLRGDSVRIYPMEVFARLEARLIESSGVQPLVGKLRNALNYFGRRAVMDGQGRILIHDLPRQRAGIDGEVAVLGQQNFLEVWDRARVERQLVDDPLTDHDLTQLATLGF